MRRTSDEILLLYIDMSWRIQKDHCALWKSIHFFKWTFSGLVFNRCRRSYTFWSTFVWLRNRWGKFINGIRLTDVCKTMMTNGCSPQTERGIENPLFSFTIFFSETKCFFVSIPKVFFTPIAPRIIQNFFFYHTSDCTNHAWWWCCLLMFLLRNSFLLTISCLALPSRLPPHWPPFFGLVISSWPRRPRWLVYWKQHACFAWSE